MDRPQVDVVVTRSGGAVYPSARRLQSTASTSRMVAPTVPSTGMHIVCERADPVGRQCRARTIAGSPHALRHLACSVAIANCHFCPIAPPPPCRDLSTDPFPPTAGRIASGGGQSGTSCSPGSQVASNRTYVEGFPAACTEAYYNGPSVLWHLPLKSQSGSKLHVAYSLLGPGAPVMPILNFLAVPH